MVKCPTTPTLSAEHTVFAGSWWNRPPHWRPPDRSAPLISTLIGLYGQGCPNLTPFDARWWSLKLRTVNSEIAGTNLHIVFQDHALPVLRDLFYGRCPLQSGTRRCQSTCSEWMMQFLSDNRLRIRSLPRQRGGIVANHGIVPDV